MTWFGVNHKFSSNPMLEEIESDPETHAFAIAAWALMGSDCVSRATRGFVSSRRVAKVLPWPRRSVQLACDALESIGLWKKVEGGYAFCDWKQGPPPSMPSGVRQSVLRRDRRRCRYCGCDADNVDHVIPKCQGGTNDMANLVTACRPCNSSKGGRTPEQAGMVLRCS